MLIKPHKDSKKGPPTPKAKATPPSVSWSAAEEHTIVVIFGCALGGFIAAMNAVIVGLLVGGPVGRFKGSAGREGVSLEAEYRQ